MKYILLLLFIVGCGGGSGPVSPCDQRRNNAVKLFNEDNWKGAVYSGEAFLKECPHSGPNYTEVRYVIGYSYNRLGKELEAINHMMMATKGGLEYKYLFKARIIWARNLLFLDRPKEALMVIDKGLELSNEDWQIASLHRLKGNCLMDMKKYDKAIKILNVSLGIEDNTWTYTGLGTAYSWKKDWRKSLTNYEIALEMDPTNETAKTSIAWVKEQMK